MDNFEVYESIRKLGVVVAPLSQEFSNLLSEINSVRTFGCSESDMKDDISEVLKIIDNIFGTLGIVKSETKKILKSVG